MQVNAPNTFESVRGNRTLITTGCSAAFNHTCSGTNDLLLTEPLEPDLGFFLLYLSLT